MKREKLILLFQEKLSAGKYSPNTIRAYSSSLNAYLKYKSSKHGAIKNENAMLKDFFLTCKTKNKYAHSTIKQRCRSLCFFYNEFYDKRINLKIYSGILKHPNLPDVLTKDELKGILEKIKNLKHKAVISTIYSCGLQLSELTNIKLSDVEPEKMLIRISSPKTSKCRNIILSVKLLNLLKRYITIYNPKLYLFEGRKKNKYSARSVQQVFKTAILNSEIKKNISIRTLRHSFAVHLLDSGIDIRYVQEMLGHKNLASTQIYNSINPPSLKKIKNPFDTF